MILISPYSQNLEQWYKISKEYGIVPKVIYFKKQYFYNTFSFNALLLSENYYHALSDYEYILMYHLDSYVFEDKLDYWLEKGFDYIGGVICLSFPDVRRKPVLVTKFSDTVCFNSGFSLKKSQAITMINHHKMKVLSILNYIKGIYHNNTNNILLRIINFFMNIIISLLKIRRFNEDVIWSEMLVNAGGRLPDIKTASLFSFDIYPEYFFKENNRLPVGCHKWNDYYRFQFYKKYIIELEEYSIND
jgi:hypothetical protein